MLYTLSQYFLLFYIYSIVGYICEIISIYSRKKKIVWNRGYMLGPYLPVFGFGALIITIFLKDYQNNYLNCFILGMVYCGSLEYFTSLILEKIYHLRWWDYSNRKFNINGRVCLETSVMFGVGAIILVNGPSRIILETLSKVPRHILIPVAVIIFIIMVMDFIVSTVEVIKLKKDLKLVGTKDATQELKKGIKESLQKNYYYYARLLKAFPHLIKVEEVKEMNKLLKEEKRKGDTNEK